MPNALEPGTIMPIHRASSETMVIRRGKLEEYLYDDEGKLTKTIIMEPSSEYYRIQLEKGQWHNLNCLETGTLIFEAKDGAYTPLTSEDIMNV